jgi:hypothetical protein
MQIIKEWRSGDTPRHTLNLGTVRLASYTGHFAHMRSGGPQSPSGQDGTENISAREELKTRFFSSEPGRYTEIALLPASIWQPTYSLCLHYFKIQDDSNL